MLHKFNKIGFLIVAYASATVAILALFLRADWLILLAGSLSIAAMWLDTKYKEWLDSNDIGKNRE